jgi:hypothetical protein
VSLKGEDALAVEESSPIEVRRREIEILRLKGARGEDVLGGAAEVAQLAREVGEGEENGGCGPDWAR